MDTRKLVKGILFGLNQLALLTAALVGDYGTFVVYGSVIFINIILLADCIIPGKKGVTTPKYQQPPVPPQQLPPVAKEEILETEVPLPPPPPQPKFLCKHCGRDDFKTEINLRRHIGMKHLDKLDI